MKYVLIIFIFSLPLRAIEFNAKAYDLSSGTLLYTEKHKITTDDNGLTKILETDYVRADGKTIAKIRSDFSHHRFTPNVVFQDIQHNYIDEQTVDLEKKKVTIKHTPNGTSKSTVKSFPLTSNMIGGQGFNNYIISQFSELLAGNIKEVKVAVLSQQDFYTFEVKKTKEAEAGNPRISLTTKNMFLKMFVKEIVLTYSIEKKRPLIYEGVSNLIDEKKKPMNVRVVFEYAK